ncbi:glycoside hydrolase family 10 protein [Maribellus sediminis]|uniref:glycoside hydrolase family 10 protein n=1 Tax=Maribellus sediminis TaxID=2696285 RepID=UPI0014318A9F|nr:family 10 glycosylhydrolase [Maribellus sediminis]
MKAQFLSTVLFLLIFSALNAQPKYEFRGTWVATVVNIDWPTKPGLNSETQKKEAIQIIETQKDLGMNAIILQIRPAADAFYASHLEPWSRYLSGSQGTAPDPYYDPLNFWIEECHKRGMELHAWLNPYRVAQNAEDPLAATHIAFQHPEWILKYGNKLYFDPGIPEVRTFIAKVVSDIVRRYDLDAIHMDDYFYPYPLSEPFPDTTSFFMYNRGFKPEHLADWRRENVDITIKMLNDSIKATKPWVKFGISPFGVWRNIADDPNGSETTAGATNYDHLYADIVKWQKEGWIDYCLPQLYWFIGHPAADFEVLVNWWKKHTYGRSMYIGLAPYRIDAESQTPEWRDPAQVPTQIRLLRSTPGMDGEAFYSSKHFNRDLLGFQDSLKTDLFRKPALVPPMPWLDNTPPQPISELKKRGRKFSWDTKEASKELDKAWQYVIYLNELDEAFDPGSAKFIYAVQKGKEIKLERINKKRKEYEVRISVLDRLNNESKISIPVQIKL